MKTHTLGLSYVDVAEKAQVQMTYGDIIIDSAVLFNVKKRHICSNMVWKLETHECGLRKVDNAEKVQGSASARIMKMGA